MTRVLVTGGRGFVGRRVTSLLAAAGLEVHCVTSAEAVDRGSCRWHRADLLDAEQRRALVASVKADALVHLAWCAKPPHYWRTPENLRWLTASLDLVQLFGEAGGTRLVGAGTCAEYNWAHGYCREATTPLAPTSLYGSAKAACGLALDAYARETAMSAAWARLFFLFGPFDSPDRLVPSLVRRIGAGQPARCTAGSHIRDFLHVDDAAAALAGLLQSSVQGAVNIASGVPIRVGDVAHHVAARMERLDLLTIEDGPARDAFVCADVTRLRDEVRWKPSKDTFDRLDETIRWWRSPEAETTVGERLEQS